MMKTTAVSEKEKLVDRFGRVVNYVRLSVTDRCDFRCVYCMDEDMTFVPRKDVLTLEELELIARAFVELGVSKIRLTGGEPLIRRGAMSLIDKLGGLSGLRELVLTTNGSRLAEMAPGLKQAGVRRINISLDSLDADKFTQLTRVGKLDRVLNGIDVACQQNFERIKLNAVILKGRNDDEVLPLVEYARAKGIDISFIEEMPLGVLSTRSRQESFCSSDEIRTMIEARWPLKELAWSTGGPSRYFKMADSRSRVGFISPHSHNFCSTCNRVRVTTEGRLLLCLGNEHSTDLRAVIRAHPGDMDRLKNAIVQAIELKPERHYFDHSEEPQIVRFMNMTGG